MTDQAVHTGLFSMNYISQVLWINENNLVSMNCSEITTALSEKLLSNFWLLWDQNEKQSEQIAILSLVNNLKKVPNCNIELLFNLSSSSLVELLTLWNSENEIKSWFNDLINKFKNRDFSSSLIFELIFWDYHKDWQDCINSNEKFSCTLNFVSKEHEGDYDVEYTDIDEDTKIHILNPNWTKYPDISLKIIKGRFAEITWIE